MIRVLAVAIVLGIGLITRAGALPLWELEGTSNRIHLLGSVHFLRAQDYPLPDAVMKVYAGADVVVFEIDLSTLDPIATQAMLQRIAVDPRGKDLEDYLGTQDYSNATMLAADIDIELAALRPYEPWFAALQITQLRLGQLGFDGTWGIETQLILAAVGDAKEIRGLETLEQQFDALDSLRPSAQRAFLLQTLEDAANIDDELDRVIVAWRSGDTVTLEEELLLGLTDQPELYEQILVQRNRSWTKQIIGFTNSGKDYLVVVGALHLVGDDSVIRMLDEAGYPARQLR